jgi:hypothetical protein
MSEKLQANQDATISIRFHVGRSSFALWKRSFIGINGLILDLSVGEEVQGHKIAMPERTGIHCVLRAWLQPQLRFPAIEPALVDRSDWEHYLNRDTDIRGEGALVVLSAEAKGAPARVYIDATREFGLLPLGNFLRMFVVSLAAALVALWLRDNDVRGGVGKNAVWESIWEWVQSSQANYGPLKLAGVAAFLFIILANHKRLSSWWRSSRARARAFERWLLKKLHQLRESRGQRAGK